MSSLNSVVGGSSTSNLGAPTTAAKGQINIGLTTTTGQLTYTGTGEITDRVIRVNGTTGGATLDHSGSGFLKFTSNFAIAGSGTNNTKTLTFQGSGTGEISGNIGNTSTGTMLVNKTGTGTWTLSGANGYVGATTVSDGRLNVTGTHQFSSTAGVSGYTVAGGTLGGNGSILFTATGIVVNSGILAPGINAGRLTVATLGTSSNALQFMGGSYNVDVNGTTEGTDYDQVLVRVPVTNPVRTTGGNVDLGAGVAALNVNIGGTYSSTAAEGDLLWIIRNDGTRDDVNGFGQLTGTFAGLADGADLGFKINGLTPKIHYGVEYSSLDPMNTAGNDVVIQLVTIPEPAMIGLFSLIGLGCLTRRRKQM